MTTQAEYDAGEAALKAYVDQIEGWKASWIPEAVFQTGDLDIIGAADAATDQSLAGRQAAGAAALNAAIVAAGYGDDVAPAQCASAAAAVLAAVARLRSQNNQNN